MKIRQLLIVLASISASSQVFASWSLDNQASDLTFVSTKAIDIAEVHHFTLLAGKITNKGKAVIAIDLTSVETNIPIRNERLQEMLFETGKYPRATIQTKIDTDMIDALNSGDSNRIDIELTLDLHGIVLSITANVLIARLSETVLTVSSTKPVILTAESVKLTHGIEALRKVANLPSISNAVPVSFILTFIKSD